jgi:outer membrane protein assembly factor BamA
LIAALIISGCSNTKYLSEGELLYTGGKVKVIDSLIKRKQRKALASEFKGMLRPKPNTKILGLRPKLYFYNLAGTPKKERGLRHWLKYKVGEPPVLFSQVDLEYNEDVLQNYSENRGFFKTRTASDSTKHGQRATAEYTVRPGKQYTIRNVQFPVDSSDLGQAIALTQKRSALKPGMHYDLDLIKAERERIDSRLKDEGFYFFGPDYLLIQVDSTVGKYQVDLKMKVKEETPQKAKEVYTINDITVYPNFSILTDTVIYSEKDVLQHGDFTIIDSTKTFNPRIFDRTLSFKKGDVYNRKDHNLSLNRLINMGTFKFVKNDLKQR